MSEKKLKLKLISHSLCPFVQRAAIVLEEKGIAYDREDIDLEHPPEWFLEMSPQGMVPLLIVNGKDILFESNVICEYIDEITPGSLHDTMSIVKARHRAWMEYGSSILNDFWGYYTAENKNRFMEQGELIKKKFKRLESELVMANWKGPYFNGEKYSMVDAVFAPVFRYFDVFDKFTEDNLFESKEHVSNWRKHLSNRESSKAVVSENYTSELSEFVKHKDSYLGSLIQ